MNVDELYMICLGCDEIFELECPRFREMKEMLEARSGFHVSGTKILMAGYCADCFTERSKFDDTGLLLQVPGGKGH